MRPVVALMHQPWALEEERAHMHKQPLVGRLDSAEAGGQQAAWAIADCQPATGGPPARASRNEDSGDTVQGCD